jgi:putative two-component system response regulator
MRILIVDDSRLAILDAQQALIDGGHEVVAASSATEAMALLRRGDCHLVITDWEMPGMSGIELCEAIRHADLAGYIYIVLLSAHDSDAERIQGLCAGADDFIAKPFNPDELRARVGVAERILSLETRDIAIFALAKLAESRDPETGAHLERVRSYSRILAQQLAILKRFGDCVDAEYIRLIYMTSPLHDIGKVGIPDSVLLKPGRLDDQEFEIMKTHAASAVHGQQSGTRATARFLVRRYDCPFFNR